MGNRNLCPRPTFGRALRLVVSLVPATSLVGQSVPTDAPTMATVRTPTSVTVTIDATSAPLIEVLKQMAQQARLNPTYTAELVKSPVRVTVHCRNTRVSDAFAQVLQGTGFTAAFVIGGVTFARANDNLHAAPAQGTIHGTVSDAATSRPIRGAVVLLDEGSQGITTSDDGRYQFPGVSPGAHILRVRRLGYTKATKHVTVTEGEPTIIDFALASNATALDQVVVTGTVIPTELKAVPNAMTVITARQIEERGITRIDQLFRGDVPGLFALNTGTAAPFDNVLMFSRGSTALSGASSNVNGTFLTSPIKTYVDGVELANASYLSQIDPRSIERIEILTGPQASTIYGSNALNGVMQIFTKRGTTSRSQLTLNLLSGWVENDFSNARTPQHDDNGQLSGVEGRMSYNAGGSWNYVGPWTPAKQATSMGIFGGGRLELPVVVGKITADLMLRRGDTRSRQRGSDVQTTTAYRETGWYSVLGTNGLSKPTLYTLTGQTFGLTFGYAPASWWSHELGFGQDASNTEQRYTAAGHTSFFDTTLVLLQTGVDRRSIRYTTTARIPIHASTQATVTIGADEWQNLATSLLAQPQSLTGTLTGTTSISRQPGHNTGAFVQTQLDVLSQLFLTYGFRTEWNPAFGANAQPNYAPRYGVAYTRDVGLLTAKLRASYGRATRPPVITYKALEMAVAHGWKEVVPLYSDKDFVYNFANPDLAPEHQQGGEGGLELYLGTHGSLVITRYNQTVDGLIQQTVVDSLRSLASNPWFLNSQDVGGYGYVYQRQYLNIGSIRNQGWELQGAVNAGPLTTKATYSWSKSRVLGIDPKYRKFFTPSQYPQYQPGAMFMYLPEHTWAIGVTYARGASNIALNMTGLGRMTINGDRFYLQNLAGSIRLPQNRLNVSNIGSYVSMTSGYALADLLASHRFAASVEGVIQIQNLMDHYANDFYAAYPTLGRQLKAGIKMRTL